VGECSQIGSLYGCVLMLLRVRAHAWSCLVSDAFVSLLVILDHLFGNELLEMELNGGMRLFGNWCVRCC